MKMHIEQKQWSENNRDSSTKYSVWLKTTTFSTKSKKKKKKKKKNLVKAKPGKEALICKKYLPLS